MKERKNVIVSGASRGIGFELALNFAKRGYKVLAIARSASGLKKLSDKSKNIKTLQFDIVDDRLKNEIENGVSNLENDVDTTSLIPIGINPLCHKFVPPPPLKQKVLNGANLFF